MTMISTYCNYGIHDEDNCHNAEEGDILSELVYQDENLIEQTLCNIKICKISEKEIQIYSPQLKTHITIPTDNVINFDI